MSGSIDIAACTRKRICFGESQVIGRACRPNVPRRRSIGCSQKQRDVFRSAALTRPQMPNTLPPLRRTLLRQGRQRRGRRRHRSCQRSCVSLHRSRASCTRSENVVSATSWRGVNRSAKLASPYCDCPEIAWIVRQWSVRYPCWLGTYGQRLRCSAVGADRLAPRSPSRHDSHQPRAHASGPSLSFDVVRQRSASPDIRHRKFAPRAKLSAVLRVSASCGLPIFTVNR